MSATRKDEHSVGWRDLGRALRDSAERRLGRPLLLAYLALLVFALVLVGVSVVWMAVGR